MTKLLRDLGVSPDPHFLDSYLSAPRDPPADPGHPGWTLKGRARESQGSIRSACVLQMGKPGGLSPTLLAQGSEDRPFCNWFLM